MDFFFLDTNVIVKYYYTEPGSTWSRTVIDSDDSGCFISAIAIAEVAADLAQLHYHKKFGRRFLLETFQRFEQNIERKLFIPQTLSTHVIHQASVIALEYAIKGYDAVQIAAALNTEQVIDTSLTFISGDKRAIDVAQKMGLKTENPFDHVVLEDRPG